MQREKKERRVLLLPTQENFLIEGSKGLTSLSPQWLKMETLSWKRKI